MSFFINPIKLIIKNKNMLLQTTANEIKAKFAGSFLGMLWLIIYPLLLLGAYAAVYIYVFKVRFQLFNSNEYVILIFCGLIPFLGFTEALSNGVTSVTTNSSLMKNTMFPIELAPIKAVLVAQTTQSAGMVLLIITLAIMGKLTFMMPLFIFIWLLQILFSIGIAWILSSLNVFIRDLQNIIPVLVLFLMMISPIAYPIDMIPENLRPFLAMNPLFYIITSYQQILMFGKLPSMDIMIKFISMSLIFFFIGYWFFSKLKRVFIDNV